MNTSAPSLQDIISSLAELKQLADGRGLNDIGDLIGLVLVAANDAAEREDDERQPDLLETQEDASCR